MMTVSCTRSVPFLTRSDRSEERRGGSDVCSSDLGVGRSVTFSQIFVDYDSDSAYVGDDDGFLHKISPFFNAVGSLQEIDAAPWLASHAYSFGDVIVDTNGFIEECTTAG